MYVLIGYMHCQISIFSRIAITFLLLFLLLILFPSKGRQAETKEGYLLSIRDQNLCLSLLTTSFQVNTVLSEKFEHIQLHFMVYSKLLLKQIKHDDFQDSIFELRTTTKSVIN